MAQIILPEGAAPSTPSANNVAIYTKSDGLVYSKDDAGNEYILSGAQTTGYPTITSATSPDIFGAAGATISINNSTPVTATSFAACTSAQVGSKKKIIPAQNWNITASASLEVDGYTSGTHLMPAGANIEVIATSTTTFKVTTIFAQGTFTPTFALATPGTSSFTYTTQHGSFTKIGAEWVLYVELVCSASSAGTGSGSLSIAGFPAAVSEPAGNYITSGSVSFSLGFTTKWPNAIGAITGTSAANLYAVLTTGDTSVLDQTNIGGALNLYATISYMG